MRLVIVRPGRKVFLPLSLKERLVNNLESLLFFHLSKSSLFDQIRDQTALLVFELVINGRLHWYPFGMRCEHFHF